MAGVTLNLELWPRQLQALNTAATELLFGGATEGGKSHLIRVALTVWCLDIPGLQCLLIRKKYDDILLNHIEGPTGFRVLLAPLLALKLVSVTQDGIKFHNGSLIAFAHCQDERQFDSAQGVERHVLVVDEATQISERLIRSFRGWVRMPKEMQDKLPERWKGKFPRILYTSNPVGVSVSFFKRAFVTARQPFEIEKVEGFLRQYIPARATDNLSIDMEAHQGRLAGIGDAALAKALDEGDWEVAIGDFFPEYDEKRHVVDDFTPPDYWTRFRSFDWGTADPFAVHWYAVSDGEPFNDDLGRRRWYPRGALIVYREWYGCDPDPKKPSNGIRMRNEDMAYGILDRSPDKCERYLPTVTDSLPFQDRGGKTIAETFAECGVILTHGDTSRVPGWSQVRSRLIGIEIDSNTDERAPMLYICRSCEYLREYLPALSRHQKKFEDAVESGEATHTCDSLRLGCMALMRVNDSENITIDTSKLDNTMTFDQVLEIAETRGRRNEISGW